MSECSGREKRSSETRAEQNKPIFNQSTQLEPLVTLSLSRYSTTAGNSGFAESLSLVSPAPCRVNFVDEFHLGASDCLLHPVLADLHDLQDRLRRWRERRRVAQLNCPLLVLVAGSGLSAVELGTAGSATM